MPLPVATADEGASPSNQSDSSAVFPRGLADSDMDDPDAYDSVDDSGDKRLDDGLEASLQLMGLEGLDEGLVEIEAQPLTEAPLLPLEEAVARIHEELRTAIQDYLRGQFREVRQLRQIKKPDLSKNP